MIFFILFINKNRGLSYCEIEFMAYFNFFIKKQKIKILTTPQVAERITQIFDESLTGPPPENVNMTGLIMINT